MRLFSGAAPAALSLCLLSSGALAYPNGIPGFSGRTGATCSSCHQPGAPVPTVELSGPTSLSAGATGQYSLLIKGGPGRLGGAGLSVSGGASLTPLSAAGLVSSNGELVQSPPKAFANGQVRFDFSLVAPASAGTVMLYAAGNSANGDGDNTGDGVATTKLEVTVTGGGGSTPTMPTEPEEAKGGCSTTGGGAPLGLLGLGAALLRARRSRETARRVG